MEIHYLWVKYFHLHTQVEIMKVIPFFTVSLRGRLKFSMWYGLSHDHNTVFPTPTKLLLIQIPTGRTFCVYLVFCRYRPCNALFSRPITCNLYPRKSFLKLNSELKTSKWAIRKWQENISLYSAFKVITAQASYPWKNVIYFFL